MNVTSIFSDISVALQLGFIVLGLILLIFSFLILKEVFFMSGSVKTGGNNILKVLGAFYSLAVAFSLAIFVIFLG